MCVLNGCYHSIVMDCYQSYYLSGHLFVYSSSTLTPVVDTNIFLGTQHSFMTSLKGKAHTHTIDAIDSADESASAADVDYSNCTLDVHLLLLLCSKVNKFTAKYIFYTILLKVLFLMNLVKKAKLKQVWHKKPQIH